MTAYLPVPCPACGGLVDKASVRCTRCKTQWESALAMEYDGLCRSSERAHAVAECADWDNLPAETMQSIWDAIMAERKYHLEIEKHER